MNDNRMARARENAGLTIGQAARLLGVAPRVIEEFEAAEVDAVYDDTDVLSPITFAARCAELYGVSVEWMLGQVEERDYTTVDRMKGADKLTPGDRDILAEFAASLPRGKAKS